MALSKKVKDVEGIFRSLPPHLREVDTYRALAKAAKVKDSVVNERLGVAEILHKKGSRKKKKETGFLPG
jgi:hypothetical protein